MNAEGAIEVKPEFSEIGFFSEGLCPARLFDQTKEIYRQNPVGFLDVKAKFVIEPQCFSAKVFVNGVGLVTYRFSCPKMRAEFWLLNEKKGSITYATIS
jgi:hypothetical protein